MEAQQVDEATWATAHASCPHATYFQSPAWYATVAATRGGRPAPLGFRLADGTLAVVPRMLTRPRLALARQASFGVEGGYGGVLAPRPLRPEEGARILEGLGALHADLGWVGDPHAPGPQLLVEAGEPDVTRVIAVRPPEEQQARFSASRRRHLRLARRAGHHVTVELGPGAAGADLVYPIYAAHAARWTYTRWVRDEAWFRTLLQVGGEQLLLAIVWAGSRPVGFQIVALGPGAALQLHLATDPASNASNPGTLLIAETLADLHARGVARFDCLASGRLQDVAAFKESLGGEPVAFGRLTRVGWLRRVAQGIRSWRAASPSQT